MYYSMAQFKSVRLASVRSGIRMPSETAKSLKHVVIFSTAKPLTTDVIVTVLGDDVLNGFFAR